MIKPTKWPVPPAKTPISLGMRPVWSESSLPAWRSQGSSATHKAHREVLITGWMLRLIWVFAGCTDHFVGFVMLRLNIFLPAALAQQSGLVSAARTHPVALSVPVVRQSFLSDIRGPLVSPHVLLCPISVIVLHTSEKYREPMQREVTHNL